MITVRPEVTPLVLFSFLIACLISSLPVQGQEQIGQPVRLLSEPSRTYKPRPSTPEAIALWGQFHAATGLAERKDTGVVRDAYMGILERWALDASNDQVELLAEFEYLLFQFDRCRQGEQLKVVELLGSDAPGSLLSVAMLHIQTWHHNIDHQRFDRLEAYGTRIEKLAKLHAGSLGESPQSRQESADLLVHFAERIWQAGYVLLFDIADSALGTALDLRSDHVAARYLRAAIYEKQGLYRKALRDLETLIELRPAQGDIALRLAVQYGRRDDIEPAISQLDRLIEGETPAEDWVQTVAYQERIRIALDQGMPDLARELLSRAQSDHAQNSRLALMEIELDRRSNPQANPRSRALLDHWQSDAGITPRLRYLMGPVQDLDVRRKHLLQALEQRTSTLASGIPALKSQTFDRARSCSRLWKHLRPASIDPDRRTPEPRTARSDIPQGTSRSTNGEPSSERSATEDLPVAIVPTDSASASSVNASQGMMPSTPKVDQSVYIDEATGEAIRVDEVVELDLRQIYLTPGKRRRDFKIDQSQISVIDDGVPQDIVTFEKGDIPFTATLLLDSSGSMKGNRMARALAGARAFMTEMAPLDRARLIVASDRLRGVSSFVSAENAAAQNLADQLSYTQAAGGTALFDHLFLALDGLGPEIGRKVVIVLSDGFDLMSVVPMESVREVVRRSQIQLYWVRLREGAAITPLTGWRPMDQTLREISLLEKAVAESGGNIVEISGPEQVTEAFAGILEDLRNQIAIGYYANPNRQDGQWREVKIKAGRSDIRMRHASGYFDN